MPSSREGEHSPEGMADYRVCLEAGAPTRATHGGPPTIVVGRTG
jgi:hypothetical protein